MTTGESANGRSMSALRSARPGNRRRTSVSAATMPKTVLTGTAMAVIWSVSQKADWKAGRLMAFRTGSRPSSKVRQKTIRTGSASRSGRYSSAMRRSERRMTRPLVVAIGAPRAAARLGGACGGGHAGASSWREMRRRRRSKIVSTASETTSSTTDTAAAAPGSSASTWP